MFYNTMIGQSASYIFISIIAMVMAVFIAAPFHEFAHAYVARREGDYTAEAYGRYTLAPLAHFDLSGFLMLVFFRFGWAKPVPVDTRNLKRGKKSELLVASAGIIANLLLGVFFLFVYMLISKISTSFYESNFYGTLLGTFLEISISLNFTLAFFNLLPIFPLDGYKILSSCCKYDNGFLRFMKKYSFWVYIIVIFTGFYNFYFNYTAGILMKGLIKLFNLILGL